MGSEPPGWSVDALGADNVVEIIRGLFSTHKPSTPSGCEFHSWFPEQSHCDNQGLNQFDTGTDGLCGIPAYTVHFINIYAS